MARSTAFAMASMLPAALGSLSNNLATAKNVSRQRTDPAVEPTLGGHTVPKGDFYIILSIIFITT